MTNFKSSLVFPEPLVFVKHFFQIFFGFATLPSRKLKLLFLLIITGLSPQPICITHFLTHLIFALINY